MIFYDDVAPMPWTGTLAYFQRLRLDHENRTGKKLTRYNVGRLQFIDLLGLQEFITTDKFARIETKCAYCGGVRDLMQAKQCCGCGAPLGNDGLCGMLYGIPVYLVEK